MTMPASVTTEARAPARVPAAAPPRSLIQNVVWTVGGTGIYSLSQWLVIVVLARAGSTRSVGQYAMGLATTAPIVLLAGLQLRDVQATDVRRQHAFGHYLALRLLTLGAALVAIVVAAGIGGPSREGFWTIVLIGVAKVFESLSDIHYGLLQQHERMDRIAQSAALRGVTGLAAVAAGQVLTGSAVGAAGALALTWAAAALFFDRHAVRSLDLATGVDAKPRFEGRRLFALFRTSAPLGVVLMLVSLQTNVPRYFVQHRLGTDELGVFAALASVFIAGNLFVNAIGQSVSPRMARAFAAQDWDGFRRGLGLVMAGAIALGSCGAALALVWGRPILALLFGAPYAARAPTFTTLMLVAGLAYIGSALGYALTAVRCFAAQLPMFAAVVAAEIAASAALVPRFGLLGASLAWGMALLAQCVGTAGLLASAVRRQMRTSPAIAGLGEAPASGG
jgi:O-antigen/teichoic acid export membrane protein